MSHLQKIFDVWEGNAEAMATDIGETGVTVRQWRNRGNIHSDHWPKIIKQAWERRGQVLELSDFLPMHVRSDLPVHSDHDARPLDDGDSVESRSTSATKTGENICTGGEGRHGHPFSQTCSPIPGATATTPIAEPNSISGTSRASSTGPNSGEAEAA